MILIKTVQNRAKLSSMTTVVGICASEVNISKLTVTYFMDDHKNIQRKISKLVKKDVTKYIQQQKYEKNMHMIFRFVA